MVDIQDRRYLAQCTQQLSSTALAELLDFLLIKHPSEVVERKGGESYHIDFGTLSAPAYADVREFVKKSLGDDDDFGFMEPDKKGLTPLASLSDIKGFSEEDDAQLRAKPREEPMLPANDESANVLNPQVPARNRPETESTPALRYPSSVGSANSSSREQSGGESSDMSSFSPDKKTSKLKRVHLSPEEKEHSKKDESRYYNGERVWRHGANDLHFSFHGVDVVLLSLRTETKRPWKCGVCEKAFVSKDKIVNHVQQHSGEKIHECPTCHGKFSSKHYLKEHQKRVHLFNCHYCEETFDTFDELHNHSVEVHPEHAGLKACSCKKGCNNSRCSCFKNGLNCTSHCQCLNCNNMA